MTPFYQHNGITIYCGDCLEIMPKLEPGFDAIIADWPYGTTACSWDSIIDLSKLWPECKRLTNGPIVTTSNEPFTSILITNDLKLFKYRWTWRKSRPTGFLDSAHKPLRDSEDIPVFYESKVTFNPQKSKGKPNHVKEGKAHASKVTNIYSHFERIAEFATTDKFPRLVLEFASLDPSKTVHETQKPVSLYQYLIRTYTNPGELVLDNAIGSGTTLRAAQNEGRQAVGIELDEEYCRIAVQRLRQQSFSFPARSTNNGNKAELESSAAPEVLEQTKLKL